MIPGWAYVWLARIFSGEQLEKGSRRNTKFHLSFAAAFPVLLLCFCQLGAPYLDKAGYLGLWLFLMAACATLFVTWILIYRFLSIPTIVILSILGWITAAVVFNISSMI